MFSKEHFDISEFDNSALYIIYLLTYSVVTKLFCVWVVNYAVMDLQKSDKCNRGYFLNTKFVMWEHE